MEMIDFLYDGQRLSSFGLMFCDFDTEGDIIDVGNDLDLNHTRAVQSDKFWAIGPRYEQQVEYDFSLCRNPCVDINNMEITDLEIRKVMRWLNRKSFHEFRPSYDGKEFDKTFLRASFNVDVVRYGTMVVGFKVHMTTDAPYAWGDEVKFSGTVNPNRNLLVKNISDEMGYQYVEATIHINQSGDLLLTNTKDPGYVISIKNCQSGEIIHFPQYLKQVTTSRASHKIYNDFNYNYPRVVADHWETNYNYFQSNLSIELEIKYNPVRKVGFVG